MRPHAGYGFPAGVGLGPIASGLPSSQLICRCPLSPTTPQGHDAARACCFTSHAGFTISESLATLNACVTRLKRVHAERITADTFAVRGFEYDPLPDRTALVATRSTSNYHGQFLSINKISQASWRTRDAEPQRKCCWTWIEFVPQDMRVFASLAVKVTVG